MPYQKELVHSPDWCTIFIMDAMRYDVFKEIVTEDKIEGKLKQAWSPGCETGIWMRNMFTDRLYPNITLVSNSAIYWKPENRYLIPKFGKTVPLWKGWREIDHGAAHWGGVMPTSEVLENAEKHHLINPDMRMIIHDIPPHLPFCDDEGYKFLERLMPQKNQSIAMRLGDYGRSAPGRFEELRGYYKASARQTLHTIIDCKWVMERGGFVITSDHGEMIGEGEQYGHSLNYKELPVLRHVPWLEVN